MEGYRSEQPARAQVRLHLLFNLNRHRLVSHSRAPGILSRYLESDFRPVPLSLALSQHYVCVCACVHLDVWMSVCVFWFAGAQVGVHTHVLRAGEDQRTSSGVTALWLSK